MGMYYIDLHGAIGIKYRYKLDGRWLESTKLKKAADKLPEARGGLQIRNFSLY